MLRIPRLTVALLSLSFGACAASEVVEPGLEALRDREVYAELDREAVVAVAHLAEQYWAEEFAAFRFQGVEHFSAAGISHWIALWEHEQTGLEFALLPGGRFPMGSPATEKDHREEERLHWVQLDPLLVARTECTWQAWAKGASIPALPKDHVPGAEQLPVSGIGPIDVALWCAETGLQFPTEAQWEYMCRAGTTSAWASGADPTELKHYANLGSLECPESWLEVPGIAEEWHDGFGAVPAPVGSFRSNAFGLYDVHGNLNEWVRDEFFDYATTPERGTGARLGSSGEHLARGGSFGGGAAAARTARRLTAGAGINPGGGGNHGFGFRASLDLTFDEH